MHRGSVLARHPDGWNACPILDLDHDDVRGGPWKTHGPFPPARSAAPAF